MRFPTLIAPSSLVLLATVLVACASGGSSSSDASATQSVSAADGRRTSNLLTQSEIQETGVATAFDAVQRLRPAWLRTRDRGTVRRPIQYALVYLDGSQYGGLDALHRISAGDVSSIRFLSASEATMRFGTGHEGGAIMVTTRR